MPRAETLSLELLRTFATLLECNGNAAMGAAKLNVNQPSMSKRLSYLQHPGTLLDRPWLVREGKRWKLTGEGSLVLPAVREILSSYDNLSDFASGMKDVHRRVRFACGQQAARGFVLQALLAFRKEHPDIRLRILTLRGKARITGVASGALDLATVTHDEARIRQIARKPLAIEHIRSDRLALVCAASSPWSADLRKLPKTKASLEMLPNVPLILPDSSSGVRKAIDDVLQDRYRAGDLNILLEIGGWSTILQYVTKKLGVGLVSKTAIENPSRFVIRLLDPKVYSPIETKLIYPQRGPSDAQGLNENAHLWRDALRRISRKK